MLKKRVVKKLIIFYSAVVLLFFTALIPAYYHYYNLFYDVQLLSEETIRYSELKEKCYYTLFEDPDGKFSDTLVFLDNCDFIPMNKKDASAVLDNLTQNDGKYVYLPCTYYGEETEKIVPVYMMIIKEQEKTYCLFYLSKVGDLHMFYNFYEVKADSGYSLPTGLEWSKFEENFSQKIKTKAINCLKSYIHTFRLRFVLIAVVLIVGGSVIIVKKNKTISIKKMN